MHIVLSAHVRPHAQSRVGQCSPQSHPSPSAPSTVSLRIFTMKWLHSNRVDTPSENETRAAQQAALLNNARAPPPAAAQHASCLPPWPPQPVVHQSNQVPAGPAGEVQGPGSAPGLSGHRHERDEHLCMPCTAGCTPRQRRCQQLPMMSSPQSAAEASHLAPHFSGCVFMVSSTARTWTSSAAARSAMEICMH